jgi:hypothetical protein
LTAGAGDPEQVIAGRIDDRSLGVVADLEVVQVGVVVDEDRCDYLGLGLAGAIPVGQRATEASLRARLTAALDRNKQLADENARLRRQLARALGDQRSAGVRSGNDPKE